MAPLLPQDIARSDEPSSLKISCCAVAKIRAKVVVAFHVRVSSNWGDEAKAVVNKLLHSDKIAANSKLTVKVMTDSYMHYAKSEEDPDLMFIVFTAQDYPQRVVFNNLMKEFSAQFQQYRSQIAEAGDNALTSKAARTMESLCAKYEDLSQVDKIYAIQKDVDDVKGVMTQNISQAMSNQEDLDVVQNKTESLAAEAAVFKANAVSVKTAAWWKNMKLKLIMFGTVAAGVIIILSSFVGFGGDDEEYE